TSNRSDAPIMNLSFNFFGENNAGNNFLSYLNKANLDVAKIMAVNDGNYDNDNNINLEQQNKSDTQANIDKETELSSTENVVNSDSENNSDNKFSISSMIASLKSLFYKTLQSDTPADLHGTYSQKEFQDCCFEGEETTEKYHHLQLASPINVTGESEIVLRERR
ncbi:MAG: hypothetical protein WCL34_09525, partial [Methylococcaceae bacterium]